MTARWFGAAGLCVLLALATTGCGEQTHGKAKGKDDKKGGEATKKDDPKHEAWWCEEHGVPEHLCSLCSEEMAAKFKKEGKWCKIHERAEEQCFKCDPARYAKFEAMYESKYGKKPPRPPEEEFKK